jgi:hypothetical protein
LLKSGDGESAWQPLTNYGNAPIITAIAVQPQNSQVIYAAGRGDPPGAWASTVGAGTITTGYDTMLEWWKVA